MQTTNIIWDLEGGFAKLLESLPYLQNHPENLFKGNCLPNLSWWKSSLKVGQTLSEEMSRAANELQIAISQEGECRQVLISHPPSIIIRTPTLCSKTQAFEEKRPCPIKPVNFCETILKRKVNFTWTRFSILLIKSEQIRFAQAIKSKGELLQASQRKQQEGRARVR